jgi:hypothetical protein
LSIFIIAMPCIRHDLVVALEDVRSPEQHLLQKGHSVHTHLS